MATPTNNYIPVTQINPAATGAAQGLVYGSKWGYGLGTWAPMTYSFPSFLPTYVTGYSEFTTFTQFNKAERDATKAVLGSWADVTRLTFTEVFDSTSSSGEMRFGITSTDIDGAVAHAYLPTTNPVGGDVWYAQPEWNTDRKVTGDTVPKGSFDYFVMLHETGHALGLKHPFETEARNPVKLPEALDSYFHTVMSYSPKPGLSLGTSTYYPTTPMFYDILAMQALYGANLRKNVGDTTYTFEEGQYYWETIYDTGGTDTIVFNGSSSAVIRLTIGHFSELTRTITFSDGTSTRATVSIGPSSVIENATGGSGNDTIVGNEVVNRIVGNAGNDTLLGLGGNDTISGGDGDDLVYGGVGLDRIDGGTGLDTVSYATSVSGVWVNLAYTTTYGYGAGGEAAGDVLTTVENVIGSAYADTLIGNGLANRLTGNAGDDTLRGGDGNDALAGGDGIDLMLGGTGADRIDGGNGIDTISYDTSATGVTVNLAYTATYGYGIGGDAGGDVITTVENITGSALADVLTGDALSNRLTGNAGHDTLQGGGGNDILAGGAGDDLLIGGTGADRIDGGDGIDTISYVGSFTGVTINLATLSGSGSDAFGDVVTTVENVQGSSGGDRIVGNQLDNRLAGGSGLDTLTGGLGADTFVFDTSLQFVGNFDYITDMAVGVDKIALDNAVFAAIGPLGQLAASAFAVGTAAADADDRIIYDNFLGWLSYDADGSGAGAAIAFASVASNSALSAQDFMII